MGRLDGKVALISGAARGMGLAHAHRFVREGAKVVITDLLDDEGQRAAATLGDEVRYLHADVTEYSDWTAAVEMTVATFGRLDILVNNAGIGGHAPVAELSIELWNRLLAVNLTGSFFGIRAVTPALRLSKRGSIINVSSMAGLQGFEQTAGYTASKYGLRGLTKVAALDLGRYNIRVNSVHPGVVDTPLASEIISNDPSQNHVALRRYGEPHEVTNLVTYLASDEASFSTGSEFVVDGGATAGRTTFVD